jgi:hypothetical protein
MKTKIVVLLLALILFTMACNIADLLQNESDQSDLQATLYVMQTQVAEIPQTDLEPTPEDELEPQPEPMEEASPTPEPTEEPSPTPEPEPDFRYEYLSLNYHDSLASRLRGEIIPENLPDDEGAYDFAEARHIRVNFDDFIIGEHFHTPVIRVYDAPRFQEISDHAVENMSLLATLLTARPENPEFLPFLPLIPAARFYIAQVEYIEFDGGSGVRYLCQMGQALWPVNNMNLFYTFQGMTDDGRYYISAMLPVNHPELSYDGSEAGTDWEPYYSEDAWNEYHAQVVSDLNGYPPESYQPSLLLYDEMFQSVRITP